MTLAIVLIAAAAFALAIIIRFAVSQALQVDSDTPSDGQIQPIDVEAFRNLIDPYEADYLRRRLPADEFRKLQRRRLRVALLYLKVLGQNAAILARVGQRSMASEDAQVVRAAGQLVNDAFLLRRYAVLVLLKICVEFAWPQGSLADERVWRGYERLSGSAMLLGRLEHPEIPVRLSAR